MRLASTINLLLVLVLSAVGCGTNATSEDPKEATNSAVEIDSEEGLLVDGMTPEFSLSSDAVADSFDTEQLLKELQEALKQYPHEAKWKAGSRINWATFTVSFEDQIPDDADAVYDLVWQQWTTPKCELTNPEGSKPLQEAVRATIESGLTTGSAENSLVFRGFKFYVTFNQQSSRHPETSFEMQFLNAEAAADEGL